MPDKTGITIAGRPVLDQSVLPFFEYLKFKKLGNNGDPDFSPNEINDIFSIQGAKNVDLDVWLEFSMLARRDFARDAYEYLQKNHLDLIQASPGVENLCTNEPCHVFSAGIEATLSLTDGAEIYYLFRPSVLNKNWYYVVDENGLLCGSYIGSTLFIQGLGSGTIEKLKTPKQMSLDLSGAIAVKYNNAVPYDRGSERLVETIFDRFEDPGISLTYSSSLPFYKRRLFVNGVDILPQIPSATGGEKYEFDDGTILSRQEPSPKGFIFVFSRFLSEGKNEIKFQAQDIFGRQTVYNASVYKGRTIARETPVISYGGEPETDLDGSFTKEVVRLVEQFNDSHKNGLESVHIYRDVSHVNMAKNKRVYLSPRTRGKEWKEWLEAVWYHEVYGHTGFRELSPQIVQKLNDIYNQLIRIDKSSEHIHVSFEGTEKPIDVFLREEVRVLNGHEQVSISSIDEYGVYAVSDDDEFFKKSAIYVFKDGLYLGDPQGGHPWGSVDELYVSVSVLLMTGYKEKLLKKVKDELSGKAGELACALIKLIEETTLTDIKPNS